MESTSKMLIGGLLSCFCLFSSIPIDQNGVGKYFINFRSRKSAFKVPKCCILKLR